MTKILLVDDDPLHAAVRKAILVRKYPDVQRVSDAAEALCLVEQPQFAYDLNMIVASGLSSGIGLANFVSEIHLRMPDLPVLVIDEKRANYPNLSGYRVEFLKRPVTADDLLTAVSKMLENWAPSQLKTA
ncbi:MAG TPA: hypothetical protein VGJ30_14205 [Candidatus Angelobacter sp.]